MLAYVSGRRRMKFMDHNYHFYVKKTTVLNTLVTMTITSDIENSKN